MNMKQMAKVVTFVLKSGKHDQHRTDQNRNTLFSTKLDLCMAIEDDGNKWLKF